MTNENVVEKVIEENRKKDVCEKAPATDATPGDLAKDIAKGTLSCRCIPKEKIEAVNAELKKNGVAQCPIEEIEKASVKMCPLEKTAPNKCANGDWKEKKPTTLVPEKAD
jgi:hypothetical protein